LVAPIISAQWGTSINGSFAGGIAEGLLRSFDRTNSFYESHGMSFTGSAMVGYCGRTSFVGETMKKSSK